MCKSAHYRNEHSRNERCVLKSAMTEACHYKSTYLFNSVEATQRLIEALWDHAPRKANCVHGNPWKSAQSGSESGAARPPEGSAEYLKAMFPADHRSLS